MGESGGRRSRDSFPIVLRILLGIGFLIALGATGVVVFADDVRMLRLAAVLALWAALIAAFAVTRSRRDARAAAMRENEAQLAYQLELHREVAARREYEADLTRQVASAQSDQLAELRGQLERLTSVLTSLADGELTVSRLTLSAESARFRSLSAADVPARTPAAVGGGRYPAVTIESDRPDSAEQEALAGQVLQAQVAGSAPAGGAAVVERAGGDDPGSPGPAQGAESVPTEPVSEELAGPAPIEPESAEPAQPVPADSPRAEQDSAAPQETVPRQRPDAPAASWARRHRASAEAAGSRSPVTTFAEAGSPPPAGAADAGGRDTGSMPVTDAAAATESTGTADGSIPVTDAAGAEEPTGSTDVPPPVTAPAEPAGSVDLPVRDGDSDEDTQPGDHESGVPLAQLLAAYGLSGRSRRRRQE
jgi:hypothetical protein